MRRRHAAAAALALLAFGTVLATLAWSRTYFNYGTETDYVGSFVREAERVLCGAPLVLEWHPPLYPLLLALVQGFTDDWLASGLLISYLCGIAVIVCSFLFFRRLAGGGAGWGAVLGLAGSGVFVEYAASATSDVFFLALFFASYLLVLLAIATRHPLCWAASGLVMGLALLARSNAITLLLLAAAPFLCQGPARQQGKFLLLLLLGLALPLLAWAAYASASGAPLLPRSNYVNLALTYHVEGSDRISYYARQEVLGRFDSALDVLLHDPARVAKVYVVDLARMVRDLPLLLEPPLNLLFAPGLVFLIIRCWNRVSAFFLAVTLAQVLLVNMKAFDPRFYLFLVPFFGAGVAETCARLLEAVPRRGRTALASLLVLGSAGAVAIALVRAQGLVHRSHDELADAVPKARTVLNEQALLLARKPHLSFYTGSGYAPFPDVRSRAALREAMADRTGHQSLYLFFGEQERASWPELSALSSPGRAPDWLQPVAASGRPGSWTLYRYAGAADRAPGPE